MIDHWSRVRATVCMLAGALLFLPSLASAQVKPDGLGSERVYQQACDDGDMVACNVFGLMNEYGDGVPQDLGRAAGLYQRACEGAEFVGCTNLGLLYEAGLGVTQDSARAVGLYRVACEGGGLLGCSRLRAIGQTDRVDSDERFSKSGQIANTETGDALSSAIIQVPDLDILTTSDVSGWFELTGLPTGRYALRAEHVGYEVLEGQLEVPGNPKFLVLLTPAVVDDPLAPGRVIGLVTDEGGNRGLSDVDITVVGHQARAFSNPTGRFDLRGLEPGLTEIRFTRLGYAPRTATLIVHPGRTLDLSATMFTEPIELEPIEVTVRSRLLEQNGFYRRALASLGRQFTRQNMEDLNSVVVSDVVRRVGGLQLLPDPQDPNRIYANSRRSSSFTLGACRLPVYIDGVEQSDDDLNQIDLSQIEAMEVYDGVNMPVQYSSARNSCGVVLIWTRS